MIVWTVELMAGLVLNLYNNFYFFILQNSNNCFVVGWGLCTGTFNG